jgi:hypothetical protein
MGRACSTHGRDKQNAYRVYVVNPEGKSEQEDLDEGGRII